MGLKDWFIKPSTRAFVKEAGATPGYSFLDLVHGYIYGAGPICISASELGSIGLRNGWLRLGGG